MPPSSPTVDPVPPNPRRRKGLVLIALVLVALVVSGAVVWSNDEQDWYHHADQGTQTLNIAYEWFIALPD